MSAVTSALVIGGGVAGPVAATALRAAGIEATVYEAYPGPAYNIGSALGFAPNGLAAWTSSAPAMPCARSHYR